MPKHEVSGYVQPSNMPEWLREAFKPELPDLVRQLKSVRQELARLEAMIKRAFPKAQE